MIAAHAEQDQDIKAEETAYLIKSIPQLGTSEEIRKFAEDWETGSNFINIDKLIPAAGMDTEALLDEVVQEGIPRLLFQNLTRAGMFSKGDAGPAEVALAIMSNSISFPKGKGGDIEMGGKRIEVKGGGKEGKHQGGGRIWGKDPINQVPMTEFLEKINWETSGKTITVIQANDPESWDENFPTKEFAKVISKVWFGKIIPTVVNSFGTANFRPLWNNLIFDLYAKLGEHAGILIIGTTTYKYIVNGAQLLNTNQSNAGSVYAPSSKQGRDLHIQISI
jgi:hypothetical protein